MCGTHLSDGTPVGHDHDTTRPKRIFYPRPHPRSRRAFLGQVGKGTLAMAVFTPTALAACGSDGPDGGAAAASTPTQSVPVEPTSGSSAGDDAGSQTAPALRWARAELGFVSAYVLARGNTAAIVDTGVAGSAAAIGETLATLGLNYSDVAHVILTHHHSDHAGSIAEVLDQAVNATAYAGEADLASIAADVTGLVGGEDVFGFEMLATPGHTAGHIAVIDHTAGLLVAGDAIFTEGGGVIEGPERFFDDVGRSRETIKALADLSFNTLLVGHGEPIDNAADSAVAALAASLS